MSNKPVFVGVDDGHYSIKVVSDKVCVTIPSRAKSGRHLISWQGGDDGFFYDVEEGGVFTVDGNLQSFEDTRFKEYPKSALNRVLVHHALAKAGFGGQDVVITTGLPVSYYYLSNGRKDDALIKGKVANLRRGVACGNKPLANILKNTVSTEAIAAYFDQLMDMAGKPTAVADELADSVVGVIDIGGKTTDCAVVHPGGEQVDVARSGSSDTGVLLLNDAVESRLRSQFDLDNVPPRMVEAAIRSGEVKIAGEMHSVMDMVIAEKEKLADQIMSGVRTRIGSGKDLDFVLFVGGGAIVMREQIAKHFPHGRFAESPEYANARGMFKIAKYIFGA